ncbi:protein cordon-bleu [Colossoma macropomum]|uniref:protein cordon-bleu n=1 Tax=Colossoma macropomum TaxID=42526 RepID=UPI001864EB30|nr:protein cordon-bleu [Colossoma macropomum]
MEQEELIERDLTLAVQLPGGEERAVTVHGSKPVMDLLVTLCGQYHLNPSDHIIELISTNQNQIKFKPNSLIGSLEAERVVLKPKGSDDSNRRASNMPVATVRLMINYRKSHKAVVRVNPRVPLAELMPAVCEKCEFDPDTTVLLRDSQSEDPLDLTKTLNDYGIRDLYAKDTRVHSNDPKDPKDPATPAHKVCEVEKVVIREKCQREKENKGFLGLFRRSKKTAEEDVSNTNSSPTSPAINNHHVVNISCLKGNSPTSTPSADMPKKRRAPQPPSMMGSQSFPCGLNSSQSINLPTDKANGKQGVLSRVSSTESSLKRTKRRAPPPPCRSSSMPDSSDKEWSCVGASLNLTSLEEAQEEDDVPLHLSNNCSNQDGDFTACLPSQSTSLMTEILSEFMDVMKTKEQGELSPDSSVTYLPPAANTSHNSQSVPGSPASSQDSNPIGSPGSLLWRNCSVREGLTTFTVVPRRRQPILRQYEVLVTLEALPSLEQSDGETEILESIPKHGDNVETLEPKEIGSPELCENEMAILEKKYGEGENREERDGGLDIPRAVKKGFDKFEVNRDMEKHSEKEGEEIEDEVSVEEERDWVEEYRERRRRFQGDTVDRKAVKLDRWMNEFEEALSYTIMRDGGEDVENGFPPPLPLYWEEEEIERDNQQERKENVGFRTVREEDDEDSNASTINPKPSSFETYHKPMADTAYLPDVYWNENRSSDLHSPDSNLDSDAPQVSLTYQPLDSFQSLSQTDPKSPCSNHQPSLVPASPTLSGHSDLDTSSKFSPAVDVPSPAPMSLFALAVSRRAQSLKKTVCPLSPSTQSSCSQTQPSRGFSQHPPSQRSSHCILSAQGGRSRAWSSPSTYTAEKSVLD